jgi:hypothetical protein
MIESTATVHVFTLVQMTMDVGSRDAAKLTSKEPQRPVPCRATERPTATEDDQILHRQPRPCLLPEQPPGSISV